VHAQSAYSSTVTMRRPPTASASGLTPFSIIDTHSDIVWRSKWVFCGWNLLSIVRKKIMTSIERTKSVAISIKISMISRAASRLSTAVGMVHGFAEQLRNGSVHPPDARLAGRKRLYTSRLAPRLLVACSLCSQGKGAFIIEHANLACSPSGCSSRWRMPFRREGEHGEPDATEVR